MEADHFFRLQLPLDSAAPEAFRTAPKLRKQLHFLCFLLFSFWVVPAKLRLERLHRSFKAFLEQPMCPATVIVVFVPLLNARLSELERITRD